jgi:hypothetical protein
MGGPDSFSLNNVNFIYSHLRKIPCVVNLVHSSPRACFVRVQIPLCPLLLSSRKRILNSASAAIEQRLNTKHDVTLNMRMLCLNLGGDGDKPNVYHPGSELSDPVDAFKEKCTLGISTVLLEPMSTPARNGSRRNSSPTTLSSSFQTGTLVDLTWVVSLVLRFWP